MTKIAIAVLLLFSTLTLAERPYIPVGLSFADSIRYSTLWWDNHDCFSNEQIKAATDLIRWQQQRIAELEKQLTERK